MFVIIGWLLALACIFGVFIAHGGNISVVLHALPFEMTTIFGAAIGGMLATNPPKVMKATMKGLGDCFKGSKYTKARYMELLALLYDILQKARKEGLMSIEKDVEDPHSSPLFQKYPTVGNDHHVTEFITDYLRMMVSGNLNAHEIESLMDAEIDTHHHEAFLAVIALQRLAGGLPAFGIVAAVLGVVNTMGSVGQPPAVLGGMIGSGGHLPRDSAGLRLRRAAGRRAGSQGRRSGQGTAVHQDHAAGLDAGLRPAGRHRIRPQGAVLDRAPDLRRARRSREEEVNGVNHHGR